MQTKQKRLIRAVTVRYCSDDFETCFESLIFMHFLYDGVNSGVADLTSITSLYVFSTMSDTIIKLRLDDDDDEIAYFTVR